MSPVADPANAEEVEKMSEAIAEHLEHDDHGPVGVFCVGVLGGELLFWPWIGATWRTH